VSLDPAVLFLALVISSIGLGLFVYGKRQARFPQLAIGLALLVFPYFTSAPRVLVGVTSLLLLTLWWVLRLGW
jgi:hypothetical protein